MNISLHDPELYYFLSLLTGIAALLASLYEFSSPRRRCDLQMRDAPSSIQDFVERHEGHAWRQLTLRLV